MAISELPIITHYDRQRFQQFGPMEAQNFYLVANNNGKKQAALYPVMGRKHVFYNNKDKLSFTGQPRFLFRTTNYAYAVVDAAIYRIDDSFSAKKITNTTYTRKRAFISFAYLVSPSQTLVCFADGISIWVYNETLGGVAQQVTDPLAPTRPRFLAAFGNRLVVSQDESTQFNLSSINLIGSGETTFNPNNCFSYGTAPNLYTHFAQEVDIIRQMAVLHNQLFIFTNFTTGIWSNNARSITNNALVVPFPFSKNTSYDFDYGMADPYSLDVGFGQMIWLGQSKDGLFEFMQSSGGPPQTIQTKAIDVLFDNNKADGSAGPFVSDNVYGFLYQYENTIFYRASAGTYEDLQVLDSETQNGAIEYNFSTNTWHKAIELNGECSRVRNHVFFNNKHLVAIQKDNSLYDWSGRYYVNERENPSEDINAIKYLTDPMRYIAITPIIAQTDYSEFITDWVQIDFVFGESIVVESDTPYNNTIYIIDEEVGVDDEPVFLTDEDGAFLITENSDTPTVNDNHYRNYFRPHIELYYSDDGGVTYRQADVRHFSDIGFYRWRMRWYELGCSRNRVYKLVCVSASPIVVLGGIMSTRLVSGGAR